MQYSKCQKCIHNGNTCKMIMAQAMSLIGQIEYLIDYSQTRKTEHKCIFKCSYSCENFTPRKEEKNAE